MTDESKLAIIEEFQRLSYAFGDTLGLDKDIILFKLFSDSWSIIEQVVHCAELDIANFHRYRWGKVSPGTTVLSFDGTWTSVLNYQASELSSTIEANKAIRYLMASPLKQMVRTLWSSYVYRFGPGKGLNLKEALQHFIRHVGFHRD